MTHPYLCPYLFYSITMVHSTRDNLLLYSHIKGNHCIWMHYWHGFWHDVHNYVSSCPECQQYKIWQEGSQGLMDHRIVERPWAVVAVDCMEFPQSKSNWKHLVVSQNFFSRWIELKPIKLADNKAIARAFEKLILFRWETLQFLLTDNGKEFDSKFLK